MPFINGQVIDEDDFIDDNERDGTPANDTGKAVKLESDAKIARSFSHFNQKVTAVAGENITGATTPQACFIMSDQRKNKYKVHTTKAEDVEADFELYNNGAGTDRRVALNFNSGAYNRITGIALGSGIEGSISSHAYILELYAVDGSGFPTGAAIGSQAFDRSTNYFDPGNSYLWIEFATPVTVSTSTNYALVIRETTTTGSASLNWHIYTHSTSGNMKYATTGTNWANGDGHGSNYSIAVYVIYGYLERTNGRVYLCDGDDADLNFFDGFVYETDTAGNNVDLYFGIEFPYFTGLSPGAPYYLSTTPGAITTTRGKSKRIGVAVSSTSIKFSDRHEFSDRYDSDIAMSVPVINDCMIEYIGVLEEDIEYSVSRYYHQVLFGETDNSITQSITIYSAGNSMGTITFHMKQGEYLALRPDRGSNTWNIIGNSFINRYII